MFLEELNPTLLATINGEFDKIAGQTAPEPTRESEDLANLGDTGSADPTVGGDPMDDLIPRVDLNKVVATTTVLKDSRSENWRVRKEAFEALEAELDRNTRLKPEMGRCGCRSLLFAGALIHCESIQAKSDKLLSCVWTIATSQSSSCVFVSSARSLPGWVSHSKPMLGCFRARSQRSVGIKR
jgi:hypothetical protein